MKNKLIMGTVQFGLDYGINNSVGKIPLPEIIRILDFAFDNGINTLDTADAYGDALEIIGHYHRLSGNRFDIISKFKISKKNIDFEKMVLASLRKLEVNCLFAYLYHSFEELLQHRSSLNSLCKLKKNGLLKYLGVSIYTNKEFKSALEFEEIDIIQLPYNLLDNQSIRGELIEKAKKRRKFIHARSIFLQGLFFKNTDKLPKNLRPLKNPLSEMHTLAENNKFQMAELALAYVFGNKSIDGVLIGIDSLSQLKENFLISKKVLDEDVLKRIHAIAVQDQSLLNPSNWS